MFGVESISSESASFLSSEISATFVFKPMLFPSFIHVKIISTSAESPGFKSVSFNWFVTTSPFSFKVQFGLSLATNSSPAGIWSFNSVAYPAIWPSFVTFILNINLTSVWSIFFLSTAIFNGFSGFS